MGQAYRLPACYGDGSVLIFSTKEFAQKAIEHYKEQNVELELKGIRGDKQMFFWANLHWWGMEDLILDVGSYSCRLKRDDLLPPPDFSELSKAQIPVVNPALILAMARHRQILFEEKKDEQWKRAEQFLCDRMLKEVVRGEFLCPVKVVEDPKEEKDADGKREQPFSLHCYRIAMEHSGCRCIQTGRVSRRFIM